MNLNQIDFPQATDVAKRIKKLRDEVVNQETLKKLQELCAKLNTTTEYSVTWPDSMPDSVKEFLVQHGYTVTEIAYTRDDEQGDTYAGVYYQICCLK